MKRNADMVEVVVPKKKKGKFVKLAVAAGAVYVGVTAIKKVVEKKKQEVSCEEGVDAAVFSGKNIVFAEGEPARDLKLKTICGGIDVNMKDAVFIEDITIDCELKAGGISIRVPEGVNVVVDQDSLVAGGVENKTETYEDAPTIHVTVKGVASGLSIRAVKSGEADCGEASDEAAVEESEDAAAEEPEDACAMCEQASEEACEACKSEAEESCE